MTKENQQISLFDYPLFSMINMDTPSDDGLNLPSDACVAYILEGDGQTFSEAESISAKPEEAIVSYCGLTLGNLLSELPEGSIHTVMVHFNREVLNKVFEGEKPELWEELQTPVTRYVVQTAANELLRHYFNNIVLLFENHAAVTELILKFRLKEIILLLLQSDNSEYVRNIIKSLFSEREFSFKELIEAQIENTDSIENLAMLTNCSVSTFKRKFRQVFGTTPAKYRIQLKLKKVADLLKTSDDSISGIGYDCGFEFPEHLSRAFKRQYGISPSQYRLNFSVK
jgi:AraC-like DNA-binding protein